jgi:hypothetical protein
LRVGYQLKVSVLKGASGTSVVCIREDKSEAVGVIFSRYAKKLIECIENGNDYIATIIDFDYGHVEVSIRRRK